MAEIIGKYVKFLRGTPTAYRNLSIKDKDTLYFVKEEDALKGELYIGEVLVSGSADDEEIVHYLNDLTDVDTAGTVTNSILGFNGEVWVPMDVNTLVKISVMTGATETTIGTQGLVPAPRVGDEKKFLKGDGTWADVPKDETLMQRVETIETQVNGDSGLNKQVADISETLNKKANSADVYTKGEVDINIANAIAAIDHLQRKIVDSYEDIEEYVNTHDDATHYIFMVPTIYNYTSESNKYDEYIILEHNGKLTIESVGSWSVDLDDYYTKDEIDSQLKEKVDVEYFTIETVDDEGNVIQEQVPGTLLAPADKDKLDVITVNENGETTVKATNVEDLETWIAENRDIDGLYSTAEKQKVNDALSSLDSLTKTVEENNTKTNARIDSVAGQLSNYVSLVDYEKKMEQVELDIETLKKAMTWEVMSE